MNVASSWVWRCGLLLVASWLTACTEDTAVDPGDIQTSRLGDSTSMSGWAVNYPKQRKVFHMAGRLWVFSSDGRDAVVQSSEDGSSWSAPLLVRPGGVFGHRTGYAFDGEFLHYAHCRATPGADVFYRRGRPLPDGTIEWSADEQLALDVPDRVNAMYPDVVVDSEGRPWIAVMVFEGGFETPPQDQVLLRSDAADGTWVLSEGFPTVLVEDSPGDYPHTTGVALSGGQTYWVYNLDGEQRYRGRLFNGEAWEPEEIVAERASRYGLFNTVAEGDVVHLVHGGGRIAYRRRAANGQWGAELGITRYRGGGHTTIGLVEPGRVAVAWLDADNERVMMREVEGETLHPPMVLMETRDLGGFASQRLRINLNSLERSGGGFRTAVAATVGAGPTYTTWVATRPQ